jgi:hypothetical protein
MAAGSGFASTAAAVLLAWAPLITSSWSSNLDGICQPVHEYAIAQRSLFGRIGRLRNGLT